MLNKGRRDNSSCRCNYTCGNCCPRWVMEAFTWAGTEALPRKLRKPVQVKHPVGGSARLRPEHTVGRLHNLDRGKITQFTTK